MPGRVWGAIKLASNRIRRSSSTDSEPEAPAADDAKDANEEVASDTPEQQPDLVRILEITHTADVIALQRKLGKRLGGNIRDPMLYSFKVKIVQAAIHAMSNREAEAEQKERAAQRIAEDSRKRLRDAQIGYLKEIQLLRQQVLGAQPFHDVTFYDAVQGLDEPTQELVKLCTERQVEFLARRNGDIERAEREAVIRGLREEVSELGQRLVERDAGCSIVAEKPAIGIRDVWMPKDKQQRKEKPAAAKSRLFELTASQSRKSVHHTRIGSSSLDVSLRQQRRDGRLRVDPIFGDRSGQSSVLQQLMEEVGEFGEEDDEDDEDDEEEEEKEEKEEAEEDGEEEADGAEAAASEAGLVPVPPAEPRQSQNPRHRLGSDEAEGEEEAAERGQDSGGRAEARASRCRSSASAAASLTVGPPDVPPRRSAVHFAAATEEQDEAGTTLGISEAEAGDAAAMGDAEMEPEVFRSRHDDTDDKWDELLESIPIHICKRHGLHQSMVRSQIFKVMQANGGSSVFRRAYESIVYLEEEGDDSEEEGLPEDLAAEAQGQERAWRRTKEDEGLPDELAAKARGQDRAWRRTKEDLQRPDELRAEAQGQGQAWSSAKEQGVVVGKQGAGSVVRVRRTQAEDDDIMALTAEADIMQAVSDLEDQIDVDTLLAAAGSLERTAEIDAPVNRMVSNLMQAAKKSVFVTGAGKEEVEASVREALEKSLPPDDHPKGPGIEELAVQVAGALRTALLELLASVGGAGEQLENSSIEAAVKESLAAALPSGFQLPDAALMGVADQALLVLQPLLMRAQPTKEEVQDAVEGAFQELPPSIRPKRAKMEQVVEQTCQLLPPKPTISEVEVAVRSRFAAMSRETLKTQPSQEETVRMLGARLQAASHERKELSTIVAKLMKEIHAMHEYLRAGPGRKPLAKLSFLERRLAKLLADTRHLAVHCLQEALQGFSQWDRQSIRAGPVGEKSGLPRSPAAVTVFMPQMVAGFGLRGKMGCQPQTWHQARSLATMGSPFKGGGGAALGALEPVTSARPSPPPLPRIGGAGGGSAPRPGSPTSADPADAPLAILGAAQEGGGREAAGARSDAYLNPTELRSYLQSAVAEAKAAVEGGLQPSSVVEGRSLQPQAALGGGAQTSSAEGRPLRPLSALGGGPQAASPVRPQSPNPVEGLSLLPEVVSADVRLQPPSPVEGRQLLPQTAVEVASRPPSAVGGRPVWPQAVPPDGGLRAPSLLQGRPLRQQALDGGPQAPNPVEVNSLRPQAAVDVASRAPSPVEARVQRLPSALEGRPLVAPGPMEVRRLRQQARAEAAARGSPSPEEGRDSAESSLRQDAPGGGVEGGNYLAVFRSETGQRSQSGLEDAEADGAPRTTSQSPDPRSPSPAVDPQSLDVPMQHESSPKKSTFSLYVMSTKSPRALSNGISSTTVGSPGRTKAVLPKMLTPSPPSSPQPTMDLMVMGAGASGSSSKFPEWRSNSRARTLPSKYASDADLGWGGKVSSPAMPANGLRIRPAGWGGQQPRSP